MTEPHAIEPELLTPPPRAVGMAWRRVIGYLTAILILGAAPLAFAALRWYWRGWEQRTLKHRAVEVEGHVVEVYYHWVARDGESPSPRRYDYELREGYFDRMLAVYEYETPSGTYRGEIDGVVWTTRVGDVMHVYYLREQPDVHFAISKVGDKPVRKDVIPHEQARRRERLLTAAVQASALLFAVGVLMVAPRWWLSARRASLVRNGVAVEGVVAEIEDRTAIYRFTAASFTGGERLWEGETRSDNVKPGESLTVLYWPGNAERNAAYGELKKEVRWFC